MAKKVPRSNIGFWVVDCDQQETQPRKEHSELDETAGLSDNLRSLLVKIN